MENDNNSDKNLLDSYLNIQGSTTQFLNKIAKAPVQVSILEQRLCEQFLYRESLLYTQNNDKPILYARCSFYREKLSHAQLHALQHTNTPIGVILGIGDIIKQDHSITRTNSSLLKAKLGVTDECNERSFDLYYQDKLVASLVETVSKQSLSRLSIKNVANNCLSDIKKPTKPSNSQSPMIEIVGESNAISNLEPMQVSQ